MTWMLTAWKLYNNYLLREPLSGLCQGILLLVCVLRCFDQCVVVNTVKVDFGCPPNCLTDFILGQMNGVPSPF